MLGILFSWCEIDGSFNSGVSVAISAPISFDAAKAIYTLFQDQLSCKIPPRIIDKPSDIAPMARARDNILGNSSARCSANKLS